MKIEKRPKARKWKMAACGASTAPTTKRVVC
jgi:hypothetical protein